MYQDLRYRDYEITDLLIKLDTLRLDLGLASDFPQEFRDALLLLIEDVETELDYRNSVE